MFSVMNNTQEQTIDLTNLNEDNREVTFTVYRDGEVDEQFYQERKRSERRTAVLSAFRHVGKSLANSARETATNVLNEWDLAVTDSKYGSNLRGQYHTKMRNDKIARVARQYELV